VDVKILKQFGKDSYNKTFAAAEILEIVLRDQIEE